MKGNQLMSSRSVGMRDINAFAPISRIKTLRDDEGLRGTLKCHAEPSLLSISAVEKRQGRDPEQKPFGMTINFKDAALHKNTFRAPLHSGFTLIELLIVVLIIGVLAAIALPQYQKAVMRSRGAQIKQLVRVIADAERAYYMEHGQYAANFKDLDVDISLTPVKTEAGKQTGACNTAVQGTDSARASNDFYIALNHTSSVLSQIGAVGYWSKGRYQCAGFGISLGVPEEQKELEQLLCKEAKATSLYKAGEGDYCSKIEHGTLLDTSTNSWRFYKLP